MQIEQLKTKTAEMQAQMERAGEDHEKESKEFLLTVADRRASVASLFKALDILAAELDNAAMP